MTGTWRREHRVRLVSVSEELPTARLVTEPQGAMAKYRLEGEVTEVATGGGVVFLEDSRRFIQGADCTRLI